MIAEHAFGLMLAVARNVCRGNERYRQVKRFDDTGLGGVELYNKVLGVIGTGRIGRHTIRIGRGFGMQIAAFDVLQNEELALEAGFRYQPLPLSSPPPISSACTFPFCPPPGTWSTPRRSPMSSRAPSSSTPRAAALWTQPP